METRQLQGEVNTRRAPGARSQWFRASTAAKDRHGTVVRPEGIDTRAYERNPIFLFAHDAYGGPMKPSPNISNVIGRTVRIEKSSVALDIEAEFATAEVNPVADMALKMVRSGLLSAVSIGFIPKRMHDERSAGESVTVFDEVELMEISLVPVPSNPDALAMVRSMLASAHYSRQPTPFDAIVAAAPAGLSMSAVGDAVRRGLDLGLDELRHSRAIADAVARGIDAGIRRQRFAGSMRRNFHIRGRGE